MKPVLGMLLLLMPAASGASTVDRAQWLMGTELRITLETGTLDSDRVDALFRECFAIAAATERVLSRWDPQAELAQLNAAAGQRVEVSPELFAWLKRCAVDARLTEGAFDPTVGTWILDPDSTGPIGMDRVVLDQENRSVLLPAGMALDSGGDGKGVAVDRIVMHLREAGVAGLVNFGGSSSYGIGGGPEGDGWRLAVLDVSGAWIGTVVLRDAALSISRSIQVDELGEGKTLRRAHIYDPSTGELVTEPRTSIVVAPSATVAEVLSTALIVRGTAGLGLLDAYAGAQALVTPIAQQTPLWWRVPDGQD